MLLIGTLDDCTEQSTVICHRIFKQVSAQASTTITFQLPLVMLAQKWVEKEFEM